MTVADIKKLVANLPDNTQVQLGYYDTRERSCLVGIDHAGITARGALLLSVWDYDQDAGYKSLFKG